MTVTRGALQSQREALRGPLREALRGGVAPLVGELVVGIARDQDVDTNLVVAAMWDLVDEGVLDYGTNARVQLVNGG